jgi:hypothetical protein
MRGALFGVVFAVFACAEEPQDPALPEMDDLARKTIEAWDAKEYHLGRAGVKRATCAVDVTLPSYLGVARTFKGAFLWDGVQAGTRWPDDGLDDEAWGEADWGGEADRGDLGLSDWCDSWRVDPWWKGQRFRKAKMRGRRGDDGGVTVEFTASDEPHVLSFDADGVLTKAEWGTGQWKRTQELVYERCGDKYLLKGSKTGGSSTCKAEIRHETVAGYQVPQSIRMVVTVTSDEGTAVSEARFTDWKFDDAAK